MDWKLLVVIGIVLTFFWLWSRQHFNPIATDLCTWYVNTFPDMPPEYQDGIHSACDTYSGRCHMGQTWGELTSLSNLVREPHIADSGEIYSPYPYLLGRISSDLCSGPAKCETDMDCNPLYTNLKCQSGKCL